MSKTKTQLIERALKILMVSGAGQTIDAEDSALVDDLVQPVIDQLAASNVVVIGNIEAIDDSYFLPLARILANEAAPEFGIPYSVEMKLEAERQIYRVTSENSFAQPLATDYF